MAALGKTMLGAALALLLASAPLAAQTASNPDEVEFGPPLNLKKHTSPKRQVSEPRRRASQPAKKTSRKTAAPAKATESEPGDEASASPAVASAGDPRVTTLRVRVVAPDSQALTPVMPAPVPAYVVAETAYTELDRAADAPPPAAQARAETSGFGSREDRLEVVEMPAPPAGIAWPALFAAVLGGALVLGSLGWMLIGKASALSPAMKPRGHSPRARSHQGQVPGARL